ncbi:hypothetical protein MAM1_0023c01988 [Mucor ambiguus]|uniref:Uncharacterized protein n=1 Tax=Mucor ambiguus TaxID=91626 RepID=A0A0C9M6T0_9FUNG|nr:hypothetical protein MAM1_0023c01988 [Mucor ambiguus]
MVADVFQYDERLNFVYWKDTRGPSLLPWKRTPSSVFKGLATGKLELQSYFLPVCNPTPLGDSAISFAPFTDRVAKVVFGRMFSQPDLNIQTTSLRNSVIEQLKEIVHNNVEDARILIETLTTMNTISEVDERNQNTRVDTEELEQLLFDAIKEDPNYKKLEELKHHRYMLPRDHYKQRNKDGD